MTSKTLKLILIILFIIVAPASAATTPFAFDLITMANKDLGKGQLSNQINTGPEANQAGSRREIKANSTLAVVYPNLSKPINEIYDQILKGIQKEYKGTVKLVKVPNKLTDEQVADFARQTANESPDMVIALGRSGRKVGKALNGKIPWVTTSHTPFPRKKHYSGITPIADPVLMMNNLKELAPQVKRIYIVYSKRAKWFVNLVKLSAKDMGYDLHAYPVKNRAQALKTYNDLTKNTLGKGDAVWLPVDKVSVEKDNIMPLIIEKAWQKRFVVVSSSPKWVRYGVLFSLIPAAEDNGIQLVKMVETMYNDVKPPGVKTSSIGNLAVNLRTASHLGLKYTSKQKEKFILAIGNN